MLKACGNRITEKLLEGPPKANHICVVIDQSGSNLVGDFTTNTVFETEH